MGQGGWIAGLRRRRSTIGLAASVVLLFNLLVSGAAGPLLSFAAADPLQAFLAEHLCAPDRDPGADEGPTKPGRHLPDCPACGNSCPMGGCAPVNAAAAFQKPVQPPLTVARVAYRSEPAVRTNLALYPSDSVSQAPPGAI